MFEIVHCIYIHIYIPYLYIHSSSFRSHLLSWYVRIPILAYVFVLLFRVPRARIWCHAIVLSFYYCLRSDSYSFICCFYANIEQVKCIVLNMLHSMNMRRISNGFFHASFASFDCRMSLLFCFVLFCFVQSYFSLLSLVSHGLENTLQPTQVERENRNGAHSNRKET